MTLKRIDPLSCGKLLGVLYAFGGLIIGVFFLLITVIGIGDGGAGNNLAGGAVGGLFTTISMPIFYGVIGFMGGVLFAIIFNACASVIGGIEMHFDE